MATILCPTSWGSSPCYPTPKNELDRTAHYWVIAVFSWNRYVTLWPWPLTSGPWSYVTWWSTPMPSLRCVWLTVPELGRLQFSIDRQLKVAIFTFLGIKGPVFKVRISDPQKAVSWPERRIMTYWAWERVQRCDLWPQWNNRDFHASNWLFAYLPRPPTSMYSPWNFVCGVVSGTWQRETIHRVREVVIAYISSFMKIGWGVSGLWGRSKIALSHWQGSWLVRGRWNRETWQRGTRLNRLQRVEHPSAQEKIERAER